MAQTVGPNTDKTDSTTLKPAQQRRALALQTAREVLVARSVVSSAALDSGELIRVAEYIIEGEPA